MFKEGAKIHQKEMHTYHEACATKDLKFGDKIIKAKDVHYSTLSTLKNYAEVISTDEYLNHYKKQIK